MLEVRSCQGQGRPCPALIWGRQAWAWTGPSEGPSLCPTWLASHTLSPPSRRADSGPGL